MPKHRKAPRRSLREGNGFIDVRAEARIQREREALKAQLVKEKRLRLTADFSAEELQVLAAKVAQWQLTHEGLPQAVNIWGM